MCEIGECRWNLLGIRPEPDELEASTKDLFAELATGIAELLRC
ncbi:hypothetical protein COLO4_04721 [Corchorus olitorius]|uniref:Uncharacterized protein n=1 Tax=Corchorus olitorius TaxID=93759 RepID=A0A1R3KSZ2_9ROSI|nr:hypothetical protein COLO4_04721 [Corchorus olitorius]